MILGIESTCDETAAAVVHGPRVLSSVVATQNELHQIYRGVVPEIASRAHIENILPVLQQALADAGVTLDHLDAIAVAARPGLIGSLLIGVTAAKTLAWTTGKPLIAVDHVAAHLYSVTLENDVDALAFPALGLVASGGHTAMYRINGWLDVQLIGKTIDDAVGEAYDKVAAMLDLPYPGGPVIDKIACDTGPGMIDFPQSMLGRQSLDFSFSGLKTSVRYKLFGMGGGERTIDQVPDAFRRDVAASFQRACVQTIIKKLRRGIEHIDARSVILGGGVSANRGIRAAVQSLPVPCFVPKLAYCTDNAAMIAGLAGPMLSAGLTAELNLEAISTV